MLGYVARAAGFALMLALAACAQPEKGRNASETNLPVEQLTVQTAAGPVRFEVEIADTEAERARGLMFRESLADGAGMLFDFDPPEPVSFWMRNTIVSLDIIFIGPDGRILNIADHAPPYSEAPIPSSGAVRGVLEIRAGRAEALGIHPGDQVRHRIFPRA
jgi:uncharacterized membrane protein (UPF0127 family)